MQKGFVKEIKEKLKLLEGQVKGKRFFGGDAVGYLDIAASGFAHWLSVFEEVAGVRLVTEEEFPDLCRWAKEYSSVETVRRCLPDREKLLAHFTARKDFVRVHGEVNAGAQVTCRWIHVDLRSLDYWITYVLRMAVF